MQIVSWGTFVIITQRVLLSIPFIPRPDANKDEPIYIVEVGAGHGKLGFLILNHLAELAEFMPHGMCEQRP